LVDIILVFWSAKSNRKKEELQIQNDFNINFIRSVFLDEIFSKNFVLKYLTSPLFFQNSPLKSTPNDLFIFINLFFSNKKKKNGMILDF
jgi:hypothetical protein